MKLIETKIKGSFLLKNDLIKDQRGFFVKSFHRNEFVRHGLCTDFQESYYTKSHKNVLRGMHYQRAPYEHAKLVTCIEGSVLDVVLDLRKDSLTYKEYVMYELNSENYESLYIPKGCAHGFYTLSESAILSYQVETLYSLEHDTGILWNSAGINWPTQNPILSARDQGFRSLESI